MTNLNGRGCFWRAWLRIALLTGLASPLCAIDISTNSHLSIQNDFLYYNNRVYGPNPSGSFLTPGHFATENLSLLHTYIHDDVSWETAADGRMADDDRIETKRFNLKRFYSKYSRKNDEALVGDYLASFSPYTLMTSLKGGRYVHKFSDTLDATVLFGIVKPNWNDLWNNNLTENVDRKFYGARVSKKFDGDAFLGTSLVWSDDSRAKYNTTAILSNQRIGGVDWALPNYQGLWLHGEEAFSRTDNDNPTALPSTQRGWAHLVHADYAHKRFKTQNDFERVSPEYATTGGAASPDLIRLRTQNQYRFTGPWSTVFNYSWFHNNLNHADGGVTSTTQLPEVGVRYDGPDWRPTLSAGATLRNREVTLSSSGLRDRTRSLSTNLTDRLGQVNVDLDYELQNQDKSDGTQGGLHHILGIGFTTTHQWPSGFQVMPSLRWNLQRDRDKIVGASDQTTVLTANLTAQSPWGADGGLSYSRNLVLNAVNPSSERRAFTASLGYNIFKHPEHRVDIRFKQNNNHFSTPGQDFNETVWEFELNNRF